MKCSGSINRKSLLYKTGVEYGDYTVNHVQGCSHGCLYPCYAMMMAKRFGTVKNYDEWIKPKIVDNAIELLEKELPKLKNKIKSVQLCFTTDPFMYQYEDIKELSISILKLINSYNIPCTALTKGVLPKELVDLSKKNSYGITLISLNESFRPYPTPNFIDQNLDDILNAVAFTDKIIFGRLHYNKKVSEYKDYKKFYNNNGK